MSDSLRPHGLYSPWNSPGQNTGVGRLSLLQCILPTQGLNPGLPHCRWILYQLSHKGSPEYTKELYKKGLYDPDNHNGVISHLEPDILECEDKWALGSITMNKASEGDGIAAKLFQILKDDGVKVLHSICRQIWNTQQLPGLEKVSSHSYQPHRRAIPKSLQTTIQSCSFHMLAKLCSKSFKLGFSSELRTFRCSS